MASAVMLACASQAASFIWGFDNGEIEGPGSAYNIEGFLDGGYAVLYIGGVEVARATQDLESFKFGSFNLDSPATSDLVNNFTGPSDFVAQAYTLVLRTDDDAFEVVYNGTSAYETVVGMGTTSYVASFTTNSAITADSWSSVAVPEPTSGLLLLLGMAGLALRRKQA
jgi:hypothetical protein